MNSPFSFVIWSAVAGFISILADQIAYQTEKVVLDLEFEIRDQRSIWFETIEANRSLNEIQSMILQYDRYFDLDYNYAAGRENFVIEDYDISSLYLLKNNVLKSLETLSGFTIFPDISAKDLRDGYISFGTPITRDIFYSDLKQLEFYAYDQIGGAVTRTFQLAEDSVIKTELLYEELADHKLVRQIALLSAIAFSLFSLLSLFLFFRFRFSNKDILDIMDIRDEKDEISPIERE